MNSRRPPMLSSSRCFETPPSLSPSCLEIPLVTKANDIKSLSIETRLPSSESSRRSDTADLLILFCHFILISASIILLGAVVGSVGDEWPLGFPLPFLQRLIATFSVSITTAVMMVIGKRYVLFKLAKGLRSRRVAVYSNPSIANIASHSILHGVELPLLGLSVAWGLALATSLTVNDIWETGSISSRMAAPLLSGPLDLANPNSSYILAASEQLASVMSSLCFRQANAFQLINITSANIEASQPTGVVCYPTPPQWAASVGFSYSTTMNAFNMSMEQLSSIPITARNLTCTQSLSYPYSELWFDGSDNQTLSIVVSDSTQPPSIFRFNATAIIVGGTLSSTGDDKIFEPNGTSWPNLMGMSDQWAQDITTLVCNTTCPSSCGIGISSLFNFANTLNGWSLPSGATVGLYQIVNSALSMALGAYSSVVLQSTPSNEYIMVKAYNTVFTTRYGIYILALNIIVSIIMLVVALKLRVESPLGPDFLNSTRLLLDPLKKPRLFNASLDMTVGALDDPYMLVKEDSVFLLTKEISKSDATSRGRWVTSRMFFQHRLNPFSWRTNDPARIYNDWRSNRLIRKYLKNISVTQVESVQSKD